MAIKTTTIPVLKDKTAKAFLKKIKKNTKNKSSIDFSKQLEVANLILKKAKM